MIPFDKIRDIKLLFRAIDKPLPQRILELLNTQGSLTVTDIYIKLRLEQSVVSQALADLRSVRLVTTQRQGKFIYYEVNQSRLETIRKIVDLESDVFVFN